MGNRERRRDGGAMKGPLGGEGVGWSIQNIVGGAFFHLPFASNSSVTHLAHQEIRTNKLGNVCV